MPGKTTIAPKPNVANATMFISISSSSTSAFFCVIFNRFIAFIMKGLASPFGFLSPSSPKSSYNSSSPIKLPITSIALSPPLPSGIGFFNTCIRPFNFLDESGIAQVPSLTDSSFE